MLNFTTYETNKPSTHTNRVCIHNEEARLLVDHMENGKWMRDQACYKEAIHWLNHNVLSAGRTVFDFVELPPALRAWWSWTPDSERLNDFTKVIMRDFYKKLRPCQLKDEKMRIELPLQPAGKAWAEIWEFIGVNLLNEKSCIVRTRYEYWAHWYPTNEDCGKLIEFLSNYLDNDPLAPCYVFTLRKHVYKVMFAIGKEAERRTY